MTISTSKSERGYSKWAWMWLSYTGFLFLPLFFERSLGVWLGTFAVFFVFVGIFVTYIRLWDRCQPIRFWVIVATFSLGLIAFPWNPGASTFFIYSAAFLPFCIVPIGRILLVFLVEVLLVVGEGYAFHARHWPFHLDWSNTAIAIFLMAIVGGGNIFFAQQKRADAQLRAAQQENIALAAVAERERIARDLHDVLGHTLSVIVLKAELASRLIQRGEASDHQRAATEISDVEQIARTSLAEVRETIGGYRARGLAAEIDAARQTLGAAGVELAVDSDASSALHLSADEETALALALREAVTNIVRHARATNCKLRLVTVGGQRQLVVEDNGEHAATREGNGLRGMRERIESLGGRLSLERDHGTRLLIELPLRTQPDVTQAVS